MKLDHQAIIQEAIHAVNGTPKKRTCDCMERAEEKIRIKYGADLAQLEHFKSQSSEIGYCNKRPNGVYGNRHYTSIQWNFCPFCGKQVKP